MDIYSIRVNSGAVSSEYSGCQIDVAAGYEIVLRAVEVVSTNHAGICVSDSDLLDTTKTGMTPLQFGPATRALQSTFSRGVASTWADRGISFEVKDTDESTFVPPFELIVPAGKYLAILGLTANTAGQFSVMFEERVANAALQPYGPDSRA